MKNHQKGFVNIVLIGAIVVLVAFGGYFAWKVKQKPITEQINEVSPVPDVKDETKNWKTYTNTEYGFELQYPSDWVSDSISRDIFSISYTIKLEEDLTRGAFVHIGLPLDLNSAPPSFKDFKDNLLSDINQKSNFTIGGDRAIREVKKDDQKTHIEFISFIHNNKYFGITLTWTGAQLVDPSLEADDHQNKVDTLEIFNLILSTLKFTK